MAAQCVTDSSVTMDKVMTIIQAQFTITIGLHWEILTIWLSRLVLGVHRTFKWNHSISRGIYGQLRSHIHFVQKRNRKCKILKNGMHFDNFFGNIWIRYYRNSFMLLQPSCVWSRQFNWFNLDYWWKMWFRARHFWLPKLHNRQVHTNNNRRRMVKSWKSAEATWLSSSNDQRKPYLCCWREW